MRINANGFDGSFDGKYCKLSLRKEVTRGYCHRFVIFKINTFWFAFCFCFFFLVSIAKNKRRYEVIVLCHLSLWNGTNCRSAFVWFHWNVAKYITYHFMWTKFSLFLVSQFFFTRFYNNHFNVANQLLSFLFC